MLGKLGLTGRFYNNFVLALAVIPFGIFIYHVLTYATNQPRQDDYDAILDFLVTFKRAGFPERLALLFSQHNEHRIATSRAIYATYYLIFGNINFRNLIILDAVLLSLLFLNISYFIKNGLGRGWQFGVLVLSMCIFDLSSYENMDFAMAGMQNFGVIFFFAFSLFCYDSKKSWAIWPAILFQAFCVFSSGNGNVGAFFIVLFNLVNGRRRTILASVTTFIIVSPLYYYHYVQPASDFLTLDPAKFVPFFLHTIGAHFSYTEGIFAACLLLVTMFLSLPFTRRLKVNREFLPLMCLLGFVLGSVGVMSVFRGNLPIECSFASRYFIYSHLVVALAYIFLVARLQHTKIWAGLNTAVLALLLLFYWRNYHDGSNGFSSFRNDFRRMEFHYPDRQRALMITENACKEGIYCIDKNRK